MQNTGRTWDLVLLWRSVVYCWNVEANQFSCLRSFLPYMDKFLVVRPCMAIYKYVGVVVGDGYCVVWRTKANKIINNYQCSLIETRSHRGSLTCKAPDTCRFCYLSPKSVAHTTEFRKISTTRSCGGTISSINKSLQRSRRSRSLQDTSLHRLGASCMRCATYYFSPEQSSPPFEAKISVSFYAFISYNFCHDVGINSLHLVLSVLQWYYCANNFNVSATQRVKRCCWKTQKNQFILPSIYIQYGAVIH